MVNRINITHKDYREKVKEDWFITIEELNRYDIIDGIAKNQIDRVCNDCVELVKYIKIHNIKF